MDPLDHVRAGLDGTICAVCDGPVPSGSTQVLAHREGLAVLQVDCAECGSTTLAFLDPAASDAVTADDVLDMHEFLRGWHGNLAELVGPASRSDVR